MSLRASSLQRVSAPEKLHIELTEVERNICDLLRECTAFLQQEKGIKTTCRIAGGWVRDKVNSISNLSSYIVLEIAIPFVTVVRFAK